MVVAAAAATFGALRQGVRTSDVPSVLRAMRKNNFLASDLNGLSRGTNDLGAAVAASAAQKAAVVAMESEREVHEHVCPRKTAGCEPFEVNVEHSRTCEKMAPLKPAVIDTTTVKPRVVLTVPLRT